MKNFLRGNVMSKFSTLIPRSLAASLTVTFVLGSMAWAQQPPVVRIRGAVEGVDGPMLTIKSREGADMKVRMTDDVVVVGIAKTALSEIKQGSYIGVSTAVRRLTLTSLSPISMNESLESVELAARVRGTAV